MNDQKALEIIKSGTRLYNKTISNNPELKEYLDNRYSDIPSKIFSYKEVLYRIEHNIEIRPVCRVCGNPVIFIGDKPGKSINGFRMTCSHKCHGLDKIAIQKTLIGKENRSNELKLLEKQRREQTCIERFGEKSVFIAKKEQIKNTMIQRYGGYTMQSNILKEKVKNTNLEKYGCENVFASKQIKDQIKITQYLKYGKLACQTNEIKQKMSISAKNAKEKRQNTNLQKYGSKYLLNNQKIAQKRLNTLKERHTFNTSKVEQLFKNYLEHNFPNDFEYQYKSKLYPFNCDFYIKSLDLYIEIQGCWTHGGHPFNENCQEDIERLEYMKSKNSNYYNVAIDTWTKRDVLKRQIANKNNLNYLEIFSNNINKVIDTFQKTIK